MNFEELVLCNQRALIMLGLENNLGLVQQAMVVIIQRLAFGHVERVDSSTPLKIKSVDYSTT